MKSLIELAADYRAEADSIRQRVLELRAKSSRTNKNNKLIGVLTAEYRELYENAMLMENYCEPVKPKRIDNNADDSVIIFHKTAFLNMVNGTEYPVIGMVKTHQHGLLPILDIPLMSDDRWKELCNEKKL